MPASTSLPPTSVVADEPARESSGGGTPGTLASGQPVAGIEARHGAPASRPGRTHCRGHLAALAGRSVPMATEAPALVPGGTDRSARQRHSLPTLADRTAFNSRARSRRLDRAARRALGPAERRPRRAQVRAAATGADTAGESGLGAMIRLANKVLPSTGLNWMPGWTTICLAMGVPPKGVRYGTQKITRPL